jgi:GTP-binding protein Era
MSIDDRTGFRSGFVALAGRPNVGKSTLMNRIIGEELSIVTPKAQTTRNTIRAIYNGPGVQIVFQDTPGIHEPKNPLNLSMVSNAINAVEDCDVVLLVVQPGSRIHQDEHRIFEILRKTGKPSILAINKIDLVKHLTLLPMMEMYSNAHDFVSIIPISALNGDGILELVQALDKLLPMGPPLFPTDDISDQPTRFFVAELVREQITKLTGEEIPYKTAVQVESFKEVDGRIIIHADIHVEKDSQKKIVVGKGGKMIKQIGTVARKKIEEFLDSRVRLELFVKVTPNWTKNRKMLEEFGYE